MHFDHFDFIAPLYHRVGSYPALGTMLDVAALPVSGWLLDAGGGTGRVASTLRGQAKGIVVADASRRMLSFAVSQPGLRAAAAFSEWLPFADETFERIIMVDALHHVASQADTAQELYRVLKPGGRIVIEEPDIQSFGVKLIALGEKVLLMRSHFLAAPGIRGLFPRDARIETRSLDSSLWVMIEKKHSIS